MRSVGNPQTSFARLWAPLCPLAPGQRTAVRSCWPPIRAGDARWSSRVLR